MNKLLHIPLKKGKVLMTFFVILLNFFMVAQMKVAKIIP